MKVRRTVLLACVFRDWVIHLLRLLLRPPPLPTRLWTLFLFCLPLWDQSWTLFKRYTYFVYLTVVLKRLSASCREKTVIDAGTAGGCKHGHLLFSLFTSARPSADRERLRPWKSSSVICKSASVISKSASVFIRKLSDVICRST